MTGLFTVTPARRTARTRLWAGDMERNSMTPMLSPSRCCKRPFFPLCFCADTLFPLKRARQSHQTMIPFWGTLLPLWPRHASRNLPNLRNLETTSPLRALNLISGRTRSTLRAVMLVFQRFVQITLRSIRLRSTSGAPAGKIRNATYEACIPERSFEMSTSLDSPTESWIAQAMALPSRQALTSLILGRKQWLLRNLMI